MRVVAVRLPDEVVHELDKLARVLGVKRSELIRRLLGLGLRCLEQSSDEALAG